MELNACQKIENIISSSPLRSNEKALSIIGLSKEIDIVFSRLLKTKTELKTMLKVFLLGEVKAGKSTLINSLVGLNLAPMSVLEATAAITEIGYAENPSITIKYKDGNKQVVTHDEVSSFFGTEQNLLEQADKVEKIVIKSDKHQFKELLLIDSPGLGTLTNQNEELTKSIMQEVDLALWVFNANHLGQTNILHQASELAKLGKPIIAIINKIDEVDDSPEDLVDFLDDNSGEYFQKIFALSAYSGLKVAVLNESQDKYFKYFSDLKLFLTDQISKKSSAIKEDSVLSSLEAILNTEKLLHQSSIRKLEAIQEEKEEYICELNYQRDKIIEDIKLSVSRATNELAIKPDLTLRIRDILNTTSKSSEIDSLEYLYKDYLNTLSNQINQVYKENLDYTITSINKNSITRINTFNKNEQLVLQTELEKFSTIFNHETVDISETATTAALSSAAGGVALAGYAAWFGAGASYVTLGAALSAIAFPITLVGLLGGAVFGWRKSIKNKEKQEATILQIQNEISGKIKNKLIELYSYRVEMDFNSINQEHERLLFNGLNKMDLIRLKVDIEKYLINLDM